MKGSFRTDPVDREGARSRAKDAGLQLNDYLYGLMRTYMHDPDAFDIVVPPLTAAPRDTTPLGFEIPRAEMEAFVARTTKIGLPYGHVMRCLLLRDLGLDDAALAALPITRQEVLPLRLAV